MPAALVQAGLIAAKDTRIFFKDRFAVVFAFIFPLMFVLGFTLALGGVSPEDDRLVLAVATLEDEGISLEVIEGLTRSTSAGIRALDYDVAMRQVEDEELAGFLAFPEDFTGKIIAGEPVALEVVVHDGNPESEAALRGLGVSLAGRMANARTVMRAVFELTAAQGRGVPDVDLESLVAADELLGFEVERVGGPPAFNAGNFTVPGYLTMFVFFAAAMSAELIARERQTHTLERLRSNGARRGAVILGKYLGSVYKGGMQLAVLWTVGILGFGIDLGASPTAVIVISALMVLASAGFGVMLASMVRTVGSASSAGVLASLILAPIGGCWWPLFIVPEWMRALAKLTPHGWANTGFNKLMLFGAGFEDVLVEMAALVVFGVAFVIVALWRFQLAEAR